MTRGRPAARVEHEPPLGRAPRLRRACGLSGPVPPRRARALLASAQRWRADGMALVLDP